MNKIFSLSKGRALCYTPELAFDVTLRLISPISLIGPMRSSITLG